MKFTISFKTPDALMDVVAGACSSLERELDEGLLETEDKKDKIYQLQSELETCGETFIKHGEYIVVEFDSEARTATVLKVKK